MRALTCALLLLVAACALERDVYRTRTTTRIDGDAVFTTLEVTAISSAGSHGDNTTLRTGLDLRGGPAPGALVRLQEVTPGHYQATVPVGATAYQYQLGDQHYLPEAVGDDGAIVTWAPPIEAQPDADVVRFEVIAPSGRDLTWTCGEQLTTTEGASIVLPDCLLPESGRYRITVERHRMSFVDGDDYQEAKLAVERVTTLDLP